MPTTTAGVAAATLSFVRSVGVLLIRMAASDAAANDDKLRRICSVLHDRYKSCISAALPRVVTNADVNAPTRMCGPLYAQMTELCAEYLRTGELATGRRSDASAESPR